MGGDRVTTPLKGNRSVLESKDPNENIPLNNVPSRSFIRVGSRVDVRDTYNYWLSAFIAEISSERQSVLVHFEHWPSHVWDACYPWDSPDIQEYGTQRWLPGQPLRKNYWLDILDDNHRTTTTTIITDAPVWRAGQITDIQPTARRLRIRYRGFNDTYDEWLKIPEDMYRIAEFESRTRNIFPFVPRKQKYWKNRQRQMIFDGNTDPRIIQYLTTLHTKGYTLRPMGGDGNCLFRSFADQVYGNQDYHSVCRAAAAEYMNAESHFFVGFVVERPEGFTGYINDIRKDGTWGDDPEIQALCEIYNRPAEIWAYDPVQGAKTIRVFHSDATANTASGIPSLSSSTNPSSSVARPPIRLSYFGGGHYDSLQGKDWEQNFLKKPIGEQEQLMIQAAQSRRQSLGSAMNTDNADDALLLAALSASRSQLEAQQDANVDAALLLSLGIDPSILHTVSGNTTPSSSSSSSLGNTVTPGIPSLEALEEENVRLAIERSQENKDDEDIIAAALRESLATLHQGTNDTTSSSSSSSSSSLLSETSSTTGSVPVIIPSNLDELYEAALELTEDEQLECALLGILPDEYIRRKRHRLKDDTKNSSSTGSNTSSTGSNSNFPLFDLPRNLLPQTTVPSTSSSSTMGSSRNRNSNRQGGMNTQTAMTKEELDIQLALLLSQQSTSSYSAPAPGPTNPNQRP